jgi:energy-coupling factor transporter ATP-binding protein EcfA2
MASRSSTLRWPRFHPCGFYLLDEPEAALSFHGCLRMLRIMHDTVLGGGQFVIATHSPVLLAYPEATIFQLSETGIDERRYDDVDSVELWRHFLDSPGRFLRHLLADDEPPAWEGTWRRRDWVAGPVTHTRRLGAVLTTTDRAVLGRVRDDTGE